MREPLYTRRFWLACSVHFCGAMAMSLYILFPLFIRALGGSEFVIGVYAGATGAAAVLARVPLGRLLDTQGRRRVLIGAGWLHVAAWLSFLSIRTLGAHAILLVIAYGLASGTLFATFFTYASDITPVTRRSEGIAMFGIWGMLPNGLGPVLGEFLIHHASFPIYFGVGAAFAFASLCLSSLLPETAGPTRKEIPDPIRGEFPTRRFLVLLCTTFLFGAAVNSLFTFLAPYAYTRGSGSVGPFFLSYSLSAVAVRVLSGRLPDRLGLRRVLVPALLAYAAGVIVVPHVTDGIVFLAVGALCGAGHGYAFPILNVLAFEQVSPAYRGRAVSWSTAMFDLGNTLANPALGAVAEWIGFAAMFTVSGCGVLIAAAMVPPRRDEG